MYAELRGGAFTRGGTFDISYVQTDTALQVLPKYYYVNATLYGTDNVLNRGPEAAMSYVESKLVNAAGKMAKLLATDMYLDGQGTNSSSIQLDGFQAAVDDGTNYTTYANVTRADIASGANVGINAYYQNIGGAVSLSQIETAFGAAWFGNEHVDLMPTVQSIWDIFWNKLQPQQRFNEESSVDVARAGLMHQPPRTATCDGKPSLIDLEAAKPTGRNRPVPDRDRLSERASLREDATVGSCGNVNRKSETEMISPALCASNKSSVHFDGTAPRWSLTNTVLPSICGVSTPITSSSGSLLCPNISLGLPGGKRLNNCSGSLSSSLPELELRA